MIVLGLEASCDETAAAVVKGKPDGPGEILSNAIFGQEDLHAGFGGVVPEIAARAHAERADRVVIRALEEAGHGLASIDAIAVTVGPGLIGGVLAGVMTAKGIATGAGLPLVGVNHLEGHALTPRLTDGVSYPYLLLLASGGHCQLIAVEDLGVYHRLGGTIDDAPGEAFDKTARLLGLGFPGGPHIE
ncbi:MAG: tRNA (adenosine(37)-N6)-threonylcarbamoyltransferase complex transferase subunit TsaD, partial [Pseudomonadota bacterium]